MRETASAQCDTHAVSYAYTDCNRNTHANTHDYRNTDAYPDSDSNAFTQAYSLTTVPPDSPPSSDSTDDLII